MNEADQRVGDSGESLNRTTVPPIHTLQVKALESWAEDSENRSRRNNLRMIGLPEGAGTLLRTILPQAPFCPHFVVERAYRMPPVRGQPGPPSRTFIFRLYKFHDRHLTLHEIRKVAELRYENTKIMLFLDYSIDTQRLRRTFDHVKPQLQTRGLKYSMLFPESGGWGVPIFHLARRCFPLAGYPAPGSVKV